VRYEDGCYRLWYEAVSPEDFAAATARFAVAPSMENSGGDGSRSGNLSGNGSDGRRTSSGVRREPGNLNLLCYAESDDGVTWHKPALPYYPYREADRTNIVYGGQQCADRGFHGAGVFRDPSAPAPERYKAIHFGAMRG
jgi:hypothetical protein